MEKDLFEDFTALRWVKWAKRKPTHNGSVFMKFNGKNNGMGIVFNGELRKLEGLAISEFKNYEDTFYWQEEIVDTEKFSEYRNNPYKELGEITFKTFKSNDKEITEQEKKEQDISMPKGWTDWNTLSLDQMADILEHKYLFSSSGEALCIHKLIEFYRKNK